MKTKYFFFAALAVGVLASCSSDELVGENSPTNLTQENNAISFSGEQQAMTRATTADDLAKLNGQFVIYGVKSGTAAGSDLQKVFTNYRLWNKHNDGTPNTTNSEGWEYVGTHGANGLGMGKISLIQDQTIKYWDAAASDYRFVAGSPVTSFSYTVDENNNITHVTVTGIDAHINANPTDGGGTALSHSAVYVADPKIVRPTNYGQPVVFSFTGQQALVRVGVYETIPGYDVTTINFYPYNADGSGWANTAVRNIVLNSLTDATYFAGGANMTATLTYDWSVPNYTFAYNALAGNTSRSWYGGAFNAGVPAKVSTTTDYTQLYGVDKDINPATAYFPVLPTASAKTPTALVIKCDYTLTSTDGSGETIIVKGATAAIPAAFAHWEKNHAYTYLFKITDKTASEAGILAPIVFDAVVVDGRNNRDGFITTVSVPSITSYQSQSPFTTVENDVVTATGIKYKKDAPIYVTVQDNEDGTLKSLTALNDVSPAVGMIKVYKLEGESMESDLQVTRPTASVNDPTTYIPAEDWTLHTKTIPTGKYMQFQVSAPGYYAVEYINTLSPSISYVYKVIHVVE